MIRHYTGNITPSSNTIFVFGSNLEGRHGAGAAKYARKHFGAIYGRAEGLQGSAYALPTKDLRVTYNNGYRSISKKDIINSIRKLYDCARQNPDKDFMIAYRNTHDKSLNGYTGMEMIDMFLSAGPIPENIVVSKEWYRTGAFNEPEKDYKLVKDHIWKAINILEALNMKDGTTDPEIIKTFELLNEAATRIDSIV